MIIEINVLSFYSSFFVFNYQYIIILQLLHIWFAIAQDNK